MQLASRSATDPIGRPLDVPGSVGSPTSSPRFDVEDVAGFTSYYREHGYVVLRSVVPKKACQVANDAFDAEVKHDHRAFYRLSGMPEPHVYTDAGFMLQGIRDVQSLAKRRYPSFHSASLAVLTDARLQSAVTAVLGEPGTIVQTMYFEGNPATQPHHDSYYLDADDTGEMVAAWVACEDIEPDAGRFFVCPGSHRLSMPRNVGDHNIVDHHDRYLAAVTNAMRDVPLEVRAPALERGDVLLWSALTIHGSLATESPGHSRRSYTAHFIGDSARFLQWQHRIVPLDIDVVDGVRIHHPKNQNRIRHRLRYLLETRAPRAMAAAKRVISARMLRRPLP